MRDQKFGERRVKIIKYRIKIKKSKYNFRKENNNTNALEDQLQRMYESNQIFLDKAILTASFGAIPLMITSAKTIGQKIPVAFSCIFTMFFLIIFFHIIGLMQARSGCENLVDKNNDIGSNQCKNAKLYDRIRDCLFLINLFIILCSMILYLNNLDMFCKI